MSASRWQRWLHQPQTQPLRWMLYQVHLWVGIVIGLYVFVISLSGSAVVFRRELTRWLLPPGNNLDSGFPLALRVLEWLVDFHDNLLAGSMGRDVNGVGAILVTVMLVTGAVIWWPGPRQWRQSLVVVRPSKTQRFSWRLHSALGFWGGFLLFGWSMTGIYFAFPEPFEWFFNTFDTDPQDLERPGEAILLVFIDLHFGRFGGLTIRVLWVILGLLPAALFVTGFMVWWKRVRPSRKLLDR